MSKKNSIWVGILHMGLGTVLAQMINIVVQPILTRIFPTETLGIYTYLISLATMIIPVASLKLDMLIVSEPNEKEAQYITDACIIINILISLIYAIVIIVGYQVSDNNIFNKYDMPILYSCHPRSKKRIESTGFKLDPRVIQHEPLGFHDYNCLQMNAFAVVSDSGTLPEESSFFTSVGHPFPAVCIRTSTERPEALDKACFILSGIDEKGLLQSVDTAVEMNRAGDYGIPVPDYIEENVSSKVVKIIQSYTGVVNKMVWRKEV